MAGRNAVGGLEDWLMEEDVPKPIKKIWPAATRIPTTDEMDHTTPEERYQLVVLCAECRNWHHFTGDKDRNSQTDSEQCECGSKRFAGGTLISERTWRPDLKKPVVKKR
jgi:hypothetical protein